MRATVLLLLLLLLLSAAGALSEPSRPNFLILFVDDWGWGDYGVNCLTASEVPGANSIDKETACSTASGRTLTPHLDTLAHQGMRFTDFHATGVCTPSRAQLQTGRQVRVCAAMLQTPVTRSALCS